LFEKVARGVAGVPLVGEHVWEACGGCAWRFEVSELDEVGGADSGVYGYAVRRRGCLHKIKMLPKTGGAGTRFFFRRQ